MDYLNVVLVATIVYIVGMLAVFVIWPLQLLVKALVAGLEDVPWGFFSLGSVLVLFVLIRGFDLFVLEGYWLAKWASFAIAAGLGGVLTTIRWWWERTQNNYLAGTLRGIRIDGQREVDDLSEALIRDVIAATGGK